MATTTISEVQAGSGFITTSDLNRLIIQYTGPISHARAEAALGNLGLDSLGAVQLSHQLLREFLLEVHPDDLLDSSLKSLSGYVQRRTRDAPEPQAETKVHDPAIASSASANQTHVAVKALPDTTSSPGCGAEPRNTSSAPTCGFADAFKDLAQSDSVYEEAAYKSGFLNYWDLVAPLENDLVLAYITEAFISLGVDLSEYPHGTEIPEIPHLPKYDRLLKRLLNILQRRYIVIMRKGKVLRGSDRIEVEASSKLYETLRKEHPKFACEADLLNLIGPCLADCINGRVDPISVLFGSAASRQVMENFYANTPMMVAHMEQLVNFLLSLVQTAERDPQVPIRILEVGSGTGGTTAKVVEALAQINIPLQYTFTDIGPSFVVKAKARWKEISWMDFSLLNIEEETPPSFRERYDIVLGANVVHATTDRIGACRRLREMLHQGGLLVLSEITHVIDWYDMCFGMLDGWWLAEGGKGYAIQPAEVWMDTLNKAGFQSADHSKGNSDESRTQQLLVARR